MVVRHDPSGTYVSEALNGAMQHSTRDEHTTLTPPFFPSIDDSLLVRPFA